MPGYQTKQENIAVRGVADLVMRSLLDRQQFFDPLGEAEALGISSASWPLFGLLWPSGAQLAARLGQRPVTRERILEIGCGLALPSLVAHRRGADVTASDRHPLAGGFLLENLALNHLLPMKYRQGQWTAPKQPDVNAPPEGVARSANAVSGWFDLIVGSDLLYERDAQALLAGFIDRHAAPEAEVWIVDPDRGNHPAFNRQMASAGFAVREERLDRVATVDALAYKGRLLRYRRYTAA